MKSFYAWILIAVTCTAHAQMRKCTDANGKVSYSDVVCPNTAEEGAVKNRVSTVDTSAIRAEMAREQRAAASAAARTPTTPTVNQAHLEAQAKKKRQDEEGKRCLQRSDPSAQLACIQALK